MKKSILIIISLNILWANNLDFCPKSITLLKDKNFTVNKIKKDILFTKEIKNSFTKLALFDKNGVLKYAGIYGYAGFPKGVWCYRVNKKYYYKDFDKHLTEKEKYIIQFYEKILKERKRSEFRVYQTYQNIIGIDFSGFVIFVNCDTNKLIKAFYYNGYNSQDTLFDDNSLKRVNKCIIKSIQNGKSKQEIEKICNLNFNIIIPDASWNLSENYAK